MNFCEKCGTKNRDNARFCNRCGNVLVKKDKPPESWNNNTRFSLERVNKTELSYDYEIKRDKARTLIQSFAIPAAGIVILPLPFSDIFFLLPIQCSMVFSIGQLYFSKEKPEKILMELISASGFSIFGQIVTLILANFIPFIGRFISAPFVYAWTVGMGELAIRYFENKGILDYEEIGEIYKDTISRAGEDYKWENKVSPEESLEKLREHMSEEEYENIKRRFKNR